MQTRSPILCRRRKWNLARRPGVIRSHSHSRILRLFRTFLNYRIAHHGPGTGCPFPEIKTYSGQGIDDRTATARFDWTPNGFHGIVLSEKGTVLIEPTEMGAAQNYIVYFQKDVVRRIRRMRRY